MIYMHIANCKITQSKSLKVHTYANGLNKYDVYMTEYYIQTDIKNF